MKVNSQLLPVKAHYFFLFAATAPMLPFLPLFGRQLGLQSGITLIYTVLPFAGVLAKVVAGGLADAKNLHKTILLGSLLVSMLGLFSIYFTPRIPKPSAVTVSTNLTLDCSSVATYLRHHHTKQPCGRQDYLATITQPTNTTCTIACSATTAAGNSQENDLQDICSSWGVSANLCQSALTFTAVVDLFSADREGADSFIPIMEATFLNTNMTQEDNAMEEFFISSNNHFLARGLSTVSSSGGRSSSINDSVVHPTCPDMTRLAGCHGLCTDLKLMEYLEAPEVPPTLGQILHYPQFWMFLCLMLIAWSSFASVVTLSDTICFMLLGRAGGEYGHQRVWGAIGWGLFVVLAGALIDAVSGDTVDKDYTPAFLLTLALFIIDILAVTRIKLKQDPNQSPESSSKPSVVSSCLTNGPAALRLLGQPRVAVFVLSCIVVGTSTGALWTYQLMLVEEVAAAWQCEFRWIKLLDGLMLGIQCFLGELPFFLLAGILLKRLGHIVCMTVVIFTFGLRFLLYSVLQNPWLFLPVEVLQGFTFGLFYSTMTSYASAVALPGTEATMQAMVGAAFEGFGVAIGGSVGGVIFFQYGGQRLFLILGVFNMVFAALFAAVNWLIGRCQPDTNYHPHYPVSSTEPISELSTGEGAPVLS